MPVSAIEKLARNVIIAPAQHTINVMHRLIVKQSKLCGADWSLFVGG